MKEQNRWAIVVMFAAAMAWVEAAVVVYLRTLIGRIQPYQPNPLPMSVGLGEIELVREAATLVMLLAVGWLAGRTWRSRLGYAAIAFGAWDILYYVFLVPISGWPRTLLDWDILFLLPLPWWGPVLAPVLIAGLAILGGTMVSQVDEPGRPLFPRRFTWGAVLAGVPVALFAFMADALIAAGNGSAAVRNVLPVQFNWPVFALALALLATPVVDMTWQLTERKKANRTSALAQSRNKVAQ